MTMMMFPINHCLTIIPNLLEIQTDRLIGLNGLIPFCSDIYTELSAYRDLSFHNPFCKYVIAELAFAGLTIFSGLEIIARTIHVLILNTLSFFVQDQEGFERNNVLRAKSNLVSSIITMHVSALALKENLQDLPIDGPNGLWRRVQASYVRYKQNSLFQ